MQTGGRGVERAQLRPDPAHDLQTLVTYRVLTNLLLEHRVARILARPQAAAVLDFPVELGDGRVLLPPEVAPEPVHAGLQRGRGQPGPTDRDAAAGLARALGAAVSERDDAAGVAVVRPVRTPLDRRRQCLRCDHAPEQGTVGRDQGDLERKHSAEVGDRSGDARDGQPAHDRHLVGQQDGGVQVDDAAAPCTGSAVPGGVHTIQPDRPERQSVHHSGGRVADHRVGSEER